MEKVRYSEMCMELCNYTSSYGQIFVGQMLSIRSLQSEPGERLATGTTLNHVLYIYIYIYGTYISTYIYIYIYMYIYIYVYYE